MLSQPLLLDLLAEIALSSLLVKVRRRYRSWFLGRMTLNYLWLRLIDRFSLVDWLGSRPLRRWCVREFALLDILNSGGSLERSFCQLYLHAILNNKHGREGCRLDHPLYKVIPIGIQGVKFKMLVARIYCDSGCLFCIFFRWILKY
jgi:hypothetical protein